MPRNGSGQYNLPYDWNDDKAKGIKVLASRMQAQDEDIATALTGSVAADGQTPLSGDLDFNANRAVDLADGQDTQDAVTVGQTQTGELQYYGLSSTIPLGTAGEDYEVNANPTLLNYVDGLDFNFLAHVDCLDNPVLRVDTQTQLQMVKDDGAGGYTRLIAGDILEDHVYFCAYNEAIGVDKLLVKNPEKELSSVDNLTVNKTIAANVFSSRKTTISNNSADANNDIDFSAGASFDVTNNVGFFLPSAITKRLDANWVAGTGQGGLDTGSKAISTWYHCYTIYNPTTNTADAIFSTNASSPSLPSGYTRYKRVGSVRTDGSGNLFAFYQNGNKFLWDVLKSDYNPLTTAPTVKTDVTTTVPSGIRVFGIYYFHMSNGGSDTTYIRGFSTNGSDPAPNGMNSQFTSFGAGLGGVYIEVLTNTSSQISCRGSGGGGIFFFNTAGWIDPTL